MKNLTFFFSLTVFFCLMSFQNDTKISATCEPCGERADNLEYYDLPRFEQGDWYSSNDIYYGYHYTCLISFNDGYGGKIFKGGTSGKYFIGCTDGSKNYYTSIEKTIRALYLYKKYNCISKRYRN